MSATEEGGAVAPPTDPNTNMSAPRGEQETAATATVPSAGPEDAKSTDSETVQGEEEDDTPPPPRKRPQSRPCGVCNTKAGKYKCPRPRCLVAYCSIACNRVHKENHFLDPPPPESETKPPPASTTTNNDPYSVLLDHHKEFTRLFQKYPNLESELLRIQQTTLPPSENPDGSGSGGGSSNGIPLKTGNQRFGGSGGKKTHTWSREAGLRRGAAALRKARTDPGDRGDGVREFCDLVLYLLSARSNGQQLNGSADWSPVNMPDATALVREEVVAEETQIIQRLLLEEGGDDRDK